MRPRYWRRSDRVPAGKGERRLRAYPLAFDPLIVQRRRRRVISRLGHRFEACVPKEKRSVPLFRAASS